MGIFSVLLTPKSQMRLGARGAWVGATAVAPRGVRTPDWPTQPVTQPQKKKGNCVEFVKLKRGEHSVTKQQVPNKACIVIIENSRIL